MEQYKEHKKINIAIDGTSSCGKSTLARVLAKKLGYRYIDTGAMYRAVTYYFMKNNIILHDSQQVQEALHNIHIEFRMDKSTSIQFTYLNGELVEDEIRSFEISRNVSQVSTIPAVRKALVEQQQKMGNDKGVVMDGRDIGTVVFPDAELKIFLTAEQEERVRRRYDEMREKGFDVSIDEVSENLLTRDHIDSTRAASPLLQAEDAIVIDNTNLTPEEQVELIMQFMQDKALV